ncbi:aminopeptidase P family protein [Vibrio sp. HN007]|uniref:aminopeptidase P family protein n=1 Tax=Vibrio iocasae TaxID=3098914 RepID=UPI0035D4F28E
MTNTIIERVEKVRNWLSKNDLDAFVIPHEDEFLGEYLPEHNERLLWATGFTGSAGAAIITRDKAAIFVDGRYTVQVTKQVPGSVFEYRHLIEEPLTHWINSELASNSKIGFDPRMHSSKWLETTTQKLTNFELLPVDDNPVDKLWSERPSPTLSDVMLMDISKVGVSSAEKRKLVAGLIEENKSDAAVLTELDSICWLLNIRGLDVSRLPVLLSHAIIYSDESVDFFIDPARLPGNFIDHVGTGVRIYAPVELESVLKSLENKSVVVDKSSTNAWIFNTLISSGVNVVDTMNPCALLKAQKNEAEISGMKACHIRDGAAMAKFLHWLDQQVDQGIYHDEAVLSDTLESYRRQDDSLVDLSFDTISAASVNAAMCHYNHLNQPTPSTIQPDTMYLVDSGGQYPDGTTDITRTVAIGKPSNEMKKQFTLVLKGHISLASAKFPSGTSGHQLDVLARQHLWRYGYDFDHGTGHGVGHFLNVHEGPQRIAKAPNSVALLPGMVLSNEPGYYREQEFGIRIENLELVVDVDTSGDMSVLGFESLTRCPIDKRCIELSLLSEDEVEWLNNYHQTVWQEVSPLLESDVLGWLKEATAKI